MFLILQPFFQYHLSIIVCKTFQNICDPVENWYWFSTDPENEVPKKKKRNNKKKKEPSDSDCGDKPCSYIYSDDDTQSDKFTSEEEDDDDEESDLPPIILGV